MPKKVKNGGGGGGGGPDGMTKNEAKRYYKVQLTGRLRDMLEKGRADALSKSDKKGSLEQTVHSWLRPEPGSNFLDNSFNMRDVIVQAAKDCRHEGLLTALRRIYGDSAVDTSGVAALPAAGSSEGAPMSRAEKLEVRAQKKAAVQQLTDQITTLIGTPAFAGGLLGAQNAAGIEEVVLQGVRGCEHAEILGNAMVLKEVVIRATWQAGHGEVKEVLRKTYGDGIVNSCLKAHGFATVVRE